MTEHDIAAHQVAKHLRAIAALLPRLSARGADPLYAVLADHLIRSPAAFIEDAADKIAATAPFEPITDEQRDEVIVLVEGQLADMSSRERWEACTEGWTDADWRAEYDDMKEYLNDE